MKMVRRLLEGERPAPEAADDETRPGWPGRLRSRLQHWWGIVDPHCVEVLDGALKVSLRELRKAAKLEPLTEKLSPGPNPEGRALGIEARATVWFNVWKYAPGEQLWAGLAHEIIREVTGRLEPPDRVRFWMQLTAKRADLEKVYRETASQTTGALLAGLLLVLASVPLGLLLLVFVGTPVTWATGLPTGLASFVLGALGWLWKKWVPLQESIASRARELVQVPDYESKLGFLHLVNEDMRRVLDLVATRGEPLVVFIDDLDRCDPNVVAKMVDALSVFLSGDLPNCIFVLAIEPAMVAAALEIAHQSLMDQASATLLIEPTAPLGWRFMEKITQLVLCLPPPTDTGLTSYIDSLCAASDDKRPGTPLDFTGIDVIQLAGEVRRQVAAPQAQEIASKGLRLLDDAADPGRRAVVAEVVKQEYVKGLTEEDPVMRDFLLYAREYCDGNPRRLKRWLNLFRFYLTLRYFLRVDQREQGGPPADMPTDEALRKYTILLMRWPQVVGLMSKTTRCARPKPGQEMRLSTVLMQAESALRGLPTQRSPSHEDAQLTPQQLLAKQWEAWLADHDVRTDATWIKDEEFVSFLKGDPALSDWAGCGLW